MTYFREEFPILEHTNFLDVAHKASVPNAVIRATQAFYEDVQATGGDKHQWTAKVEATRAAAADLVNAKPAQIAFVANTSYGMNMFAHGMAFSAGDNVVIGDQEHENNDFPWTNLAARGLEVRRVRSELHCFSVADVAACIDARTRAVSLSHVYPASGFVPHLGGIGRLCRERDVLLFVDAVQSLGAVHTDVEALMVDGLATSGHKWLLGPYGAGFMYASDRFQARSQPAFAAKLYSREDGAPFNTASAPDARRWELGSLNYAGVYGLSASLEMIASIGTAAIESRIGELSTYLYEQARRAGLIVLDVRSPDCPTSGIVSLAVDDAPSIAAALHTIGIAVSARRGLLRISLHLYNNESDIDGLLAGLKRIA